MLITKVELENIKSYRKASIRLPRGTTAIRGQNGAGKTTLVEAIGFALFDYLPYNQAQFVREGERSGQVAVTFIAKDDLDYQAVRRCGSPPAWYIYDPRLESRLVEQKADVLDWLREHLPLQSEIELGAFFSDALGVQQGTFTSDFLAAPANRKRKFDALLQVEDYRRAAEKLRDTVNHLQQSAHEVNLRIERLQGATQHLDAWRDELARMRAEQKTGTGQLLAKEAERDEAEARRAALRQLGDEVARLAAERTQAESAWNLAKQMLGQAEVSLAEARAAQQKLIESLADYRRYLDADKALRQAREQHQARQKLKDRLAAQKQELTKARSDEQYAAAQLAAAETAQRQMAELAPQVEAQAALEQQVNEARQQANRLREIEQSIKLVEAECARLAGGGDALAARIAAIETQRAEAALLDERREVVQQLALDARRRNDWEQELGQVQQQFQATNLRIAKATADEEKQQANVSKLLATRPLVETLPALEVEWSELSQQVAVLQANITRHRESKLQSAGGQCPFLHEPCLNIQRRGQSSLEAYFDRLIARDQAVLAPLEPKQAELEQQVLDVRNKKTYVDRLDEYEQFLRDAQDQRGQARQEAEHLTARERELADLLSAAAERAQHLAEAQKLLQQSDEADKQVRALDGLSGQHAQLLAQLETQTRQREALQAEQAALANAPARAEDAARQLSALNNPRSQHEQQKALASQEPEARKRLDTARGLAAQAEEALAELDAQLAPYAGLDEHIGALEQQQQQSNAGYQTYLAHEQIADKVPERQAAYDAALASERQAQQSYTLADQRYTTKAAGFNPQTQETTEREAQRLREEVIQLSGKLETLFERMEQQEQQIGEAEGKLLELEAARAEFQELKETHEMLQQFRDTIKEAGPYVMKEQLKQISREANRIFGEILGDRSAELAWEEDYEIILRSRGQERSFAQLSGGEQMSAALAVRLALLRTLANLNIAFFDEPTQNMDELRRSNLAEQIRRVSGFNQLIVISHDDTFEQGLDSVIFLSKRDGETIVGEGELALVGSGADIGFDGAGFDGAQA